MRVSLDINEPALCKKISDEYGIDAKLLEFIPVGDSAYSYVVICTEGARYYLKIFDKNTSKGSQGIKKLDKYLPLTWKLYHDGIFTRLTYPIKTVNREFSLDFGQYVLVLFNFVHGETLADSYPFSAQILEAIAKSMADIHRTTPHIPLELVSKETFDTSLVTTLLEKLDAIHRGPDDNDPYKMQLRDIILEGEQRVGEYLGKMKNALHSIKLSDTNMVLCHGDIWGGNIIPNRHGDMVLLDWENAILAPLERDLVGYIGDEFESFFSDYVKQYGESISVNSDIITYYAYRHHLRNLNQWIDNIWYGNFNEEQKRNDIDMILNHCLNRFKGIEIDLRFIQ